MLQNIDIVAKAASPVGLFAATFWLEPVQTY
jgi:hypothetical protein